MINEYTTYLIHNLPSNHNIPTEIDLVLSGGAFNGSYMLGSLYYLKELERENKIKINKISGSSIGSVLGFLYFTDTLDLFNDLYKLCFDHINEHFNLSNLLNLKQILKTKMNIDIGNDILKNKLYISLHNIQNGKKYVKNKYKNIDNLLDCIIRSCYVPFIINYKNAYKNKYIDGMLPYFYKKNKNKVLYINVFTHDKANNSLSIKNEYTNIHRILTGINEIHLFFLKNKNTYMCSYIDGWSVYEYLVYFICLMFEKMVFYSMYLTKDICHIKLVRIILKEFTKRLIQFSLYY